MQCITNFSVVLQSVCNALLSSLVPAGIIVNTINTDNNNAMKLY